MRAMRTNPNQTKEKTLDLSLVYSLLVHALLAFGLYLISKPHIPKVSPSMNATLVTPDMLREMKANAKAAKLAADARALEEKTSNNTKANNTANPNTKGQTATAVDDFEKATQDIINPTIVPAQIEKTRKTKPAKKQQEKTKVKTPQQTTQQKHTPKVTGEKRIFKPATNSAKSQTPKSTYKKTGKPNPESMKRTEDFIKLQQQRQKALENKRLEEDLIKKKIREREAIADKKLKAQQKKAKKTQQDKQDKKLKKLKKKYDNKDADKEERRKNIAKVKAKNAARIAAQQNAAKNAKKPSKTVSLGDAPTKNSSSSSANSKPASSGSDNGMSKQAMTNLRAKYNALIQSAIKRNWAKYRTETVATVPVKVRLSANGSVLKVDLKGSTGDKAVDQSIEDAIYDASPLPVPDDPVVYNKYFKSFTFKFRTR